MKLFQVLCFFVLVFTSLSLAAEKNKHVKKTKNNVEDEEVTVEEMSEEEYKEQQKQDALKASRREARDTGKDKVKDDTKPHTTEDTAKTKDAKSKDSKADDSKTQEADQPKTEKTGNTGQKETGKEQDEEKESSKDEQHEETIQEAEGEYIEDDDEVEEDPEEEPEEEHEAPSGIRDPRPCEVCKYLAVELQGRLTETGKVKEYIETGHGIMPGDRKRKLYKKSELRFIEALHEPHVCDRLLEYDIHAERKKSLRYAKGHSETRKTLRWLRMKGVKVDMGMPEEMWTRDAPSTEITHLHRLCIEMVEMHEEALEDWYWGHQEQHLYDYLCRDRALKHQDQECLVEEVDAPEGKKEEAQDGEESESAATSTDSDSTTKGDGGVPGSSMPPVAGDSSSQTASPPDPTPTQTPQSSHTATPKTEL